MSIEQKIDALTAAINALTEAIIAKVTAPDVPQIVPQEVPQVVPQEVPQAAPVAVAIPAPAPAPVVAPAPVAATMPPLPSFAMPAAPAAPAVPFSDAKGMIEYVTAAYKEMGAEKGGRIQQVLMSMGVHNINDITTPEGYAALYQGVEALRNGA